MCFGGGKDNTAQQARADEIARQNRIKAGTAKINQIFNGTGYRGIDKIDPTAWDRSKTYYDAMGQEVKGQPFIFGSTIRPQGDLYAGREAASNGFNDEFFAKQRQAYLDYANPQLEDQYGKAAKELTFSLARSGLLDSSARAEKEGDLQKLYDTNRRGVADQALTFENESRDNVERARGDLITMLNATGDAEGASLAAMNRSSILSRPQGYSPLSNLFADFTNGLSTAAAYERQAAIAPTAMRAYGASLFSPRSGVKVS